MSGIDPDLDPEPDANPEPEPEPEPEPKSAAEPAPSPGTPNGLPAGGVTVGLGKTLVPVVILEASRSLLRLLAARSIPDDWKACPRVGPRGSVEVMYPSAGLGLEWGETLELVGSPLGWDDFRSDDDDRVGGSWSFPGCSCGCACKCGCNGS